MPLNGKHLYKFGDFDLSIEENLLRRNSFPVSLTPKVFDVLAVLVRNHGRVVKKDELLQTVWADSFVEESNLTVTVNQLRKVLGDDARDPKYIQTASRRGYRFIAEVEQTVRSDSPNNQTPGDVRSPMAMRFLFLPVTVAVAVLIAAVVALSWYLQKNIPLVPILSAQFASEKLSTNGRVFAAAISPDGENVAYTIKSDGKASVWLRNLDSGNNVEIIPESENDYHGFAFSPDGKSLYFSRRPRHAGQPTAIYRISSFGGIPEKIVDQTQGWISISPDGTKLAFGRRANKDDDFSSLWIADSNDGGNERRLATRPHPIRIAAYAFSPDGKSIVFAFGQSENAANEFSLAEFALESGAERSFSNEKFFNIKHLKWLPDKSGILMTASRIPNRNFRIWQVSSTTGEAIPLTKDSEAYSVVSLDDRATRLVSTRLVPEYHLIGSSVDNPSERRVLTDSEFGVFSSDQKIFFQSGRTGNQEIWSMSTDGSGQRQLTSNEADDVRPLVSHDGRSIFFSSNRTGEAHVWRMNADGSNQTQITTINGGRPLFASPDGEWVYYHHALSRKIWRVSTNKGTEQLAMDKVHASIALAFSPDGSVLVYGEWQDGIKMLKIAELASGKVLRSFATGAPKANVAEILWLQEEGALVYLLTDAEFEKNTLWRQSIAGGAPQKIADLGNEETLSLTFGPDGKTFAYVQGRWRHDAILFKGLR